MPPPLRIAISVVLLVVAIAGIVVQSRVLQEDSFLGLPTLTIRLEIAAYVIVALYAAISIAARLTRRSPKS